MFIRALLLALVALFATSEAYKFWDGLVATWSQNPKIGFYQLPLNLKDAEQQRWTDIGNAQLPRNLMIRCYQNDPRFCLLFASATNLVAGVQIGILAADLTKQRLPLNYNNNVGLIKKTLLGATYWTATAYFRLEGTDDNTRIWTLDKKGLQPSLTDAALIPSYGPYRRKNCIPTMGGHFFRMDYITKCDNLYPWFLLETKGVISGIGFQIIGRGNPGRYRDWYEHHTSDGVKATIPDLPTCYTPLVDKYGSTVIHIWFVKNPRLITCPK